MFLKLFLKFVFLSIFIFLPYLNTHAKISKSSIEELNRIYDEMKNQDDENTILDLVREAIVTLGSPSDFEGSCLSDSLTQFVYLVEGRVTILPRAEKGKTLLSIIGIMRRDFGKYNKGSLSFHPTQPERFEDLMLYNLEPLHLGLVSFNFSKKRNFNPKDLFKGNHFGHTFLTVKAEGQLWVIHNQDWITHNGAVQPYHEFVDNLMHYYVASGGEVFAEYYIFDAPICTSIKCYSF